MGRPLFPDGEDMEDGELEKRNGDGKYDMFVRS